MTMHRLFLLLAATLLPISAQAGDAAAGKKRATACQTCHGMDGLSKLPEAPNLYFANGFSGHGMQQAAGAGRGISELILHGRYTTLDLSDLDVARVPARRPLRELNII